MQPIERHSRGCKGPYTYQDELCEGVGGCKEED